MSAKLEIGTFFVGVVMEVAKVAKQELALSTLEARHPLCNRLQGNLRSCHDAVVTQSLRSRYAVVGLRDCQISILSMALCRERACSFRKNQGAVMHILP